MSVNTTFPTTEDDDFDDEYDRRIEFDIYRNKHPEMVLYGLPVVALFVIIMFTYNYLKNAKDNKFIYIHKGHLLSGFQHQVFVAIQWYFSIDVAVEFIYYSAFVTPVWTSCLSALMFLKVYLFKREDDLYTKKGVTSFVSTSGAVVQFYVDGFCSILGYMPSMIPALRLTSVLLIISPSFVICSILIKSLLTKSKTVTRSQGLYAVLNISLLTVSDFVLVFYEFGSRDNVFDLIIAIILSVRLIIEAIWITMLYHL